MNKTFTVEAGHRAIIFNRLGGIQKDIYAEGLHFKIPFVQYPIIYDIRSRPKKISSPTGSKDLQMVNITLRVLARPDPLQLPALYRVLGVDYDERVLPSICNEVSKSPVKTMTTIICYFFHSMCIADNLSRSHLVQQTIH